MYCIILDHQLMVWCQYWELWRQHCL